MDPYAAPGGYPGGGEANFFPTSPGGTTQLPAAPQVRWIPIDVKVHWFSFLSVPDLARASRVCKSWTSLVQKTCDAQFAQLIGASLPHLARPAKLRLLDRLHHAYLPENMAYLLSWAVTSREYLPFLHKLLLLRDAIREDLGLPGGFHDPARPDAYDQLDESLKTLWSYKSLAPTAAFGATALDLAQGSGSNLPPLVLAAQKGNSDAVMLLLLFGEGVHNRRRANERALYAAIEQGNLQSIAALLGRIPLRPPRHPPHVARKLGLIRQTWDIYNSNNNSSGVSGGGSGSAVAALGFGALGGGYTYNGGVNQGPQNVAAVIAATKIRAALASATGVATTSGPRASAAAATTRATVGIGGPAGAGGIAAESHGVNPSLPPGSASSASSSSSSTPANTSGMMKVAGKWLPLPASHAASQAHLSVIESSVAQMEVLENDGRYRSWCRSYHMGSFWSLYDTALANYESIHGPIGATTLLTHQHQQQQQGGAAAGAEGTSPRTTDLSVAGNLPPRPQALAALKTAAERSDWVARRLTVTLQNLPKRLNSRLAPGSMGPLIAGKRRTEGITPAYAAQALLVSKLAPGLMLAQAAKPRKRGFVHPRITEPVDYGCLAADAVAVKVRLNVGGPLEGRTPLIAATERGRIEAAFLLLSHHDPVRAVTGEVPPPIKRKTEEEENGPGGGAGGAAAGAGAGAAGGTGAAGGNAAAGGPGAATAAGGAGAPAGGAAATAAVPAPQAAAAPAPTNNSAASADRFALAAIANATASALAVPVESLRSAGLSAERREEAYSELLQTTRDRADPDLCPPGHHTPLCIACERGNDRMVAVLLHWGADVNKQGRKDAPPLLIAAVAGHDHLIRLLVRSYCESSRREFVMNALRQIAAHNGEDETTVLLESAVAPFELKSRLGRRFSRAGSRGASSVGRAGSRAATSSGTNGGNGNEWGPDSASGGLLPLTIKGWTDADDGGDDEGGSRSLMTGDEGGDFGFGSSHHHRYAAQSGRKSGASGGGYNPYGGDEAGIIFDDDEDGGNGSAVSSQAERDPVAFLLNALGLDPQSTSAALIRPAAGSAAAIVSSSSGTRSSSNTRGSGGGGTVASSVGGMISSQTGGRSSSTSAGGNRKRRGGGGGDGDRGRAEEPVLDLSEPVIVAALAAAAAGAAAKAAAQASAADADFLMSPNPSGVDSAATIAQIQAAAASAAAGLFVPPSAAVPQGFTPLSFLPPEEASITSLYYSGASGSGASFGAFGHKFSGGAGMGALRGRSGKLGGKSSGLGGTGGLFMTGVGGPGIFGNAANGPDLLAGTALAGTANTAAALVGGEVKALRALMTQTSTGASYSQSLRESEALRLHVRALINTSITKSSILNGVGALPGRSPVMMDCSDESGYTAIFICASTGRLDSVILLAAGGADVNICTKRGKSPIYGAVEKCHTEVVEHLLPYYTAHQLRANTTYGTNVMHAAAKAGNNRIKDVINNYCVEWDAREHKRQRQAAAARRITGDANKTVSAEETARRQEAYMKRMMEGSAGPNALGMTPAAPEDIPIPIAAPDVSAQMERLKRMAEAAKRKEEEAEARRHAKDRLKNIYGSAFAGAGGEGGAEGGGGDGSSSPSAAGGSGRASKSATVKPPRATVALGHGSAGFDAAGGTDDEGGGAAGGSSQNQRGRSMSRGGPAAGSNNNNTAKAAAGAGAGSSGRGSSVSAGPTRKSSEGAGSNAAPVAPNAAAPTAAATARAPAPAAAASLAAASSTSNSASTPALLGPADAAAMRAAALRRTLSATATAQSSTASSSNAPAAAAAAAISSVASPGQRAGRGELRTGSSPQHTVSIAVSSPGLSAAAASIAQRLAAASEGKWADADISTGAAAAAAAAGAGGSSDERPVAASPITVPQQQQQQQQHQDSHGAGPLNTSGSNASVYAASSLFTSLQKNPPPAVVYSSTQQPQQSQQQQVQQVQPVPVVQQPQALPAASSSPGRTSVKKASGPAAPLAGSASSSSLPSAAFPLMGVSLLSGSGKQPQPQQPSQTAQPGQSILVSQTIGKPPKAGSAALPGSAATTAAASASATTTVNVVSAPQPSQQATAAASGAAGGSGVFERLAARAREVEARRAKQLEDAEAELKAARAAAAKARALSAGMTASALAAHQKEQEKLLQQREQRVGMGTSGGVVTAREASISSHSRDSKEQDRTDDEDESASPIRGGAAALMKQRRRRDSNSSGQNDAFGKPPSSQPADDARRSSNNSRDRQLLRPESNDGNSNSNRSYWEAKEADLSDAEGGGGGGGSGPAGASNASFSSADNNRPRSTGSGKYGGGTGASAAAIRAEARQLVGGGAGGSQPGTPGRVSGGGSAGGGDGSTGGSSASNAAGSAPAARGESSPDLRAKRAAFFRQRANSGSSGGAGENPNAASSSSSRRDSGGSSVGAAATDAAAADSIAQLRSLVARGGNSSSTAKSPGVGGISPVMGKGSPGRAGFSGPSSAAAAASAYGTPPFNASAGNLSSRDKAGGSGATSYGAGLTSRVPPSLAGFLQSLEAALDNANGPATTATAVAPSTSPLRVRPTQPLFTEQQQQQQPTASARLPPTATSSFATSRLGNSNAAAGPSVVGGLTANANTGANPYFSGSGGKEIFVNNAAAPSATALPGTTIASNNNGNGNAASGGGAAGGASNSSRAGSAGGAGSYHATPPSTAGGGGGGSGSSGGSSRSLLGNPNAATANKAAMLSAALGGGGGGLGVVGGGMSLHAHGAPRPGGGPASLPPAPGAAAAGPGGFGVTGSAFAAAAAAGSSSGGPSSRGTSAGPAPGAAAPGAFDPEAAAREQRNKMRELQKQLRLQAHKEEEERRAREAAALPQQAPSVFLGGSLALAAAAYGAGGAGGKKPAAGKRR